jgi:hypothetical protein
MIRPRPARWFEALVARRLHAAAGSARRDGRQTMAGGHAFLDEKCLLLAGEIVREIALHAAARRSCTNGAP